RQPSALTFASLAFALQKATDFFKACSLAIFVTTTSADNRAAVVAGVPGVVACVGVRVTRVNLSDGVDFCLAAGYVGGTAGSVFGFRWRLFVDESLGLLVLGGFLDIPPSHCRLQRDREGWVIRAAHGWVTTSRTVDWDLAEG